MNSVHVVPGVVLCRVGCVFDIIVSPLFRCTTTGLLLSLRACQLVFDYSWHSRSGVGVDKEPTTSKPSENSRLCKGALALSLKDVPDHQRRCQKEVEGWYLASEQRSTEFEKEVGCRDVRQVPVGTYRPLRQWLSFGTGWLGLMK